MQKISEVTNVKDCRDYDAVAILLKHILDPGEKITICYSCPNSMKLSKATTYYFHSE